MTEMTINWGADCNKCGHSEAVIYSTAAENGFEFMNGDVVKCLHCGHQGEMDACGEDSDIIWYEDDKEEG